MRVLVLKTSSLGDVIHTLPALSDARAVYPDIVFDWVLEESFADIPSWHPAVEEVIPIGLRRFKREPKAILKRGEWKEWLTHLRKHHYDCVIDAQGLLKSALIGCCTRSTLRSGFSWGAARESVASLLYHRRVPVPWRQHALMRTRALFADVLGYDLSQRTLDYGIDKQPFPAVPLEGGPYCVFLHGTTWDSKHWPESYWIALAKKVAEAGYTIQLLWGNPVELARAQRIATVCQKAVVAPRCYRLSEVVAILAASQAVVTVDTGLGHLATALNVPTISLYGPSDPALSGTFGAQQLSLAVEFPCSPCFRRTCMYAGQPSIDPPCFVSVNPERVFKKLMMHLKVCGSELC